MPSFRVTGVDGETLNVRSGGGISAAVIGSLTEGTLVEGDGDLSFMDGHSWRHITSPLDGFCANEFLTAVNGVVPNGAGQFRVTGVGSDGLNVRSAPGLSAAVIANLAEGTLVDGQDGTVPADHHDWRHITSPLDGFCADEFLTPDDGHHDGPTRHGILSVAELFELVRGQGAEPGVDRIMVAAALAESGGDTDAEGDVEAGFAHAIGLWQMHDHGLGTGLTRAQRSDPDFACEQMLPHFRAAHRDGLDAGFSGRLLAVRTYVFTERPEGFPSLQSAAAGRFLGKFDLLA